ncbi:hypothetical protein F5882DRAFT_416490 [Hyaloscypha sp. PMI_1271]|nr:hypothetical protein F5882DRAFT_416490 [Hyaloscypha sp. PMI_1271]
MLDPDPEYFVITRRVPEYERELLWAHTREIRAKRQAVEQRQLEASEATMEKAKEKFDPNRPTDKEQIEAAINKGEERFDPNLPIYTRMSRKHISIETLNTQKIDYELDQDPEYVLITRWVPEPEQDFLWEHTREIREKRQGDFEDPSTGNGRGNDEPGKRNVSKRKKKPYSPLLAFLSRSQQKGAESGDE